MSSYSSTLGFTTIFVLVNFVLVSSAPNVYNAVTSKRVYTLDVTNRARIGSTKSSVPEDSNFNGDLTFGYRNPDDDVFELPYTYTNSYSSVYSVIYSFEVNQGVFGWVALRNKEGSTAVFCGSPDSIGTPYVNFTARLNPESYGGFTFYYTIVEDQ